MSKNINRCITILLLWKRSRVLSAVNARIAMIIALMLVPLGASPARRAHASQSSRFTNMPSGGMSQSTTHEIFATFFFAGQEFYSQIILQNMRLDVPVTVTPVLMVSQGEVPLDPVILPVHGTATVDINAALSAHGLADTQGAVIVRYDFRTAGAVSALVRSTEEARYLYLNSVAWGREEYMGTTLDAVVWAPEEGTQGFISIVNTSSEPRWVQTTFLVNGRSEDQPEIELAPRQARLLPIDALVTRSRKTGAGIHLAFMGMPGDIIAQGTLLKKQNGFAKSIRFMDRTLHFAGGSLRTHFLLLGPQPAEDGFPANISFRSVAVVRNIDSAPVQVAPVVKYLQGGSVQKVNLKTITLEVNESRVMDFTDDQRAGLLPQDLHQGTLELTPNTDHTSVIGEFFTFSERTGGYALGSSFTAYPARGTESIWRTDGTFQTTIVIQNTANEEDQVTLKFFSNSTTYDKTFPLPPSAITKISVKELQQDAIPDKNGHLLPGTYGTFSLSGAHGPKSGLAFNELIHSADESDYIGYPPNGCVYLTDAFLYVDSIISNPFPIMEEWDYSDGSSYTAGANGTYSSNTNLLYTTSGSSGDLGNINFGPGTPGQDVNVGSNDTVVYECGGCSGYPGYATVAQVPIPPYVQITSTTVATNPATSPTTINSVTEPTTATLTVQMFHSDLTSVGAQTVTLQVGTSSSNPPNCTVSYNQSSQTVTLSGAAGSVTPAPTVLVTAPTCNNATIVIQALLSNPSKGVSIAGPTQASNAQATLKTTLN